MSAVEFRSCRCCEDTTERGKPEARLAVRQSAERDAQAIPTVLKVVPSATANRAVSQCAKRVAFGIELALPGGGFGHVQELSILRSEQEDQPVDEPEELAEVFVDGPGAVTQPCTQFGVGGMREEPSAECKQSIFDAVAKPIASG